MQKNTTIILSSNPEHVSHAAEKPSKKNNRESEPSRQTIQNILNYSKSLKVEPKADGKDFIEYVAN